MKVIIRTKGTDPRTTRYLQPDGTWGISSTALTFKSFKLAEQDSMVQSGEGYAVKVAETKVKRGTVLVVSKDLSFHLSAHGSVQLAKGTEVKVIRGFADGHANVEGYVTKRHTQETVNARFMINLGNTEAK